MWRGRSGRPSRCSCRARSAEPRRCWSGGTCGRPASSWPRPSAKASAAQGLDVVDLGLTSTDLVYFAAGKLDAPGAMLTASHNPAQYNGMKLCLAGARPIGEDSGLAEIKRMTADGVPAHDGPAGGLESLDLLRAFGEHVRSFVDLKVLRALKVIADTANGMGGLVVPAVFEGVPGDLEVLYGELDGTFPNHPADPIQLENLRDLQARVLEVGRRRGPGLRRRRRPGVPRRRARRAPVGVHDDRHRRGRGPREEPRCHDPAQLHLLEGRARGGARARGHARAHEGRVTASSSR